MEPLTPEERVSDEEREFFSDVLALRAAQERRGGEVIHEKDITHSTGRKERTQHARVMGKQHIVKREETGVSIEILPAQQLRATIALGTNGMLTNQTGKGAERVIKKKTARASNQNSNQVARKQPQTLPEGLPRFGTLADGRIRDFIRARMVDKGIDLDAWLDTMEEARTKSYLPNGVTPDHRVRLKAVENELALAGFIGKSEYSAPSDPRVHDEARAMERAQAEQKAQDANKFILTLDGEELKVAALALKDNVDPITAVVKYRTAAALAQARKDGAKTLADIMPMPHNPPADVPAEVPPVPAQTPMPAPAESAPPARRRPALTVYEPTN